MNILKLFLFFNNLFYKNKRNILIKVIRQLHKSVNLNLNNINENDVLPGSKYKCHRRYQGKTVDSVFVPIMELVVSSESLVY